MYYTQEAVALSVTSNCWSGCGQMCNRRTDGTHLCTMEIYQIPGSETNTETE